MRDVPQATLHARFFSMSLTSLIPGCDGVNYTALLHFPHHEQQ